MSSKRLIAVDCQIVVEMNICTDTKASVEVNVILYMLAYFSVF